jgi:phosphatidylglycerol lysyltransferase
MSGPLRSSLRAFSRLPNPLLWLGLIGVSSAIFLSQSGTELSQAVPVLTGAEPGWLLGAAVAQAACITFATGKYRVVFRRLGFPIQPLALTRAHLRRQFVSNTVPVGGPAGLLNFVRDMAEHRVTAGTAIAVSFRTSLINIAGHAIFLAPAIAWIALAGRLSRSAAIGFAVLALLVFSLFGIAIALLRCERLPDRLRSRLPARLAKTVDDIHRLGIGAADIVPGIPFALGSQIAGVAMLACAVWASGPNPGLITILTALVMASLAQSIVPVFKGAGVTEVSLVGVLHAGGLDLPNAIGATVIYRAAQFWLPLTLGGLLMARWTPVARLAWNNGPTGLARAVTAALVLVPIGIALLELDLV